VSDDARLEDLRAAARFHRERLDLYRARAYGTRPTSPQRMRELERARDLADERLATALRVAAGDRPPAAEAP
jgi:hypothetical protein